MAIVSDCINSVITELRQVPSLATQTYATPVIRQQVNNAYRMLVDEYWWEELMYTFTVAVDGTTGLLTSDLVGPISAITRYDNIQYVWSEGIDRPLAQKPVRWNPTAITGTTPQYIQSDTTYTNRPVKILPVTSTGNVVIRARQMPPFPVGDSDTLYLDDLMITYAAAWMYVIDDATVPAQVEKFQSLYMARKKQVIANMNTQDIPLTPYAYTTGTGWWEA